MSWDKVEEFVASFALYYNVYVRIDGRFREVAVFPTEFHVDGTLIIGKIELLGHPSSVIHISEVNDIYFAARGHAAPYMGAKFRSVLKCGHVWFANAGEIAQVGQSDAEDGSRLRKLWRNIRHLRMADPPVAVGVFSVRDLFDLLPNEGLEWIL